MEYGGFPLTTVIGRLLSASSRALFSGNTARSRRSLGLPRLERIGENQTRERRGISRQLGIGNCDVRRRDVVGKQEDLICVQFAGVLASEVWGSMRPDCRRRRLAMPLIAQACWDAVREGFDQPAVLLGSSVARSWRNTCITSTATGHSRW